MMYVSSGQCQTHQMLIYSIQFCSCCFDIAIVAKCTKPLCNIAVCYYKQDLNHACIVEGAELDVDIFVSKCMLNSKSSMIVSFFYESHPWCRFFINRHFASILFATTSTT